MVHILVTLVTDRALKIFEFTIFKSSRCYFNIGSWLMINPSAVARQTKIVLTE